MANGFKEYMNILLLGGAGYIGSHTITAVPRALGFLALQAIRDRVAAYMSEANLKKEG